MELWYKVHALMFVKIEFEGEVIRVQNQLLSKLTCKRLLKKKQKLEYRMK